MLQYLFLENPVVLGLPSMLLICGLAIFKGGAAERHTAILFLGVNLILIAVDLLSDAREVIANLSLVADAILALGFLWLAMRRRNLWLAGAMMAQGIAFAIHVYLMEDQEGEIAYLSYKSFALGMTMMSYIVLLLILTGTVITCRERAKSSRESDDVLSMGGAQPLAQ